MRLQAITSITLPSMNRNIKNKAALKAKEITTPTSVGYLEKIVFSSSEENVLCDYLLNCAAANFGLSTTEARKSAYRLAVRYNKSCLSSWIDRQTAGEV